MASISFEYRLQLKVPCPSISLNYIPPRINNYMNLTFHTSDLLHKAVENNFSEEENEAAFNTELNEYAHWNGHNASQVMSNRLILLHLGPTQFLTNLYNILHFPDTDPFETIQIGAYPLLFGWLRVEVHEIPESDSDNPEDDY